MSTGNAFILPLAWNPSLGVTRVLSSTWAATQPLLEIMVAAGLGSRNEIRTLTRQNALSYLFEPLPDDAEIEGLLALHRELYGSNVIGYWADVAYRQLSKRDLIAWIPITLQDLLISTDLGEGIILVKQGRRTLKRIILREDGE